MMNRFMFLTALVMILIAGTMMAAETSVHGRLYTHWEYDMTSGADGMNEFVLGRAYLTVKSKLSEYTSVRITSDLRETTILSDHDGIGEHEGKARYDLIIKYAYLDWKPEFGKGAFMVRIGLQPTLYSEQQNKVWGRRYLSKTVSDRNKFLTTSDGGLSTRYALGEKGRVGLIALALYNGAAYSDLGELNKQKDLNLLAKINLLANSADFGKSVLVAQYYKGTQNVAFDLSMKAKDYNKDIASISALIAYRDLFSVGGEMNWISLGMGAGADEKKLTGNSVYGTLYLGELAQQVDLFRTLNLFGRYDIYDPDTNNEDDREKLLIVGVECQATKGFKASVNIRSSSSDDGSPTEKELFLNTLFKF